MDFLKGFFIGDRKRRKNSESWEHSDHHDDDNHDHEDHHHGDDTHNYQGAIPLPHASPSNLGVPSSGFFCPQCSASLVPGAKFCHQCGKAMEADPSCASCGSQLLNGAAFCPHCGYKNV